MTDIDLTRYTYTPHKPPLAETSEQLRARIPGWGADLDPADRPSYPQEVFDPGSTGARWEFPERQPGSEGRERSIEHAFVTPVFGTAQPLHGLSGAVRRLAYARYSEGRAAHWLLLMAGDRIDVAESRVTSLLRGRPDRPIAETGVRAELGRHGLSSRVGKRRTDTVHHPLDPVVTVGPYALAALAGYGVIKRLSGRRR